MEKKDILEVVEKTRKETEKKKFNQSVDLIVNLKNFDVKKQSINLLLTLPNKIKQVRVAAFLNKKSEAVDSITKQEFVKYKDKKLIKKLIKKYDFFLASPSLMPQIASIFGRYLGPAGKMPSPQLGILGTENEEEIKKILEKVDRIIRIKSKEPSLKFCIGKESLKDEELAENILTAYNAILNALPRKKENIKSVLIKFTMGKPEKIRRW